MNDKVNELLDGLRKALAEFADLAHATSEAGRDAKSEATERAKGALADVREKLDDVERNLARGARTADQFVRENPWLAVAAAALVAYVLGTVGRRNR